MSGPAINYQHILSAINYYKRFGYQYIDAPWMVSKESMDVTKPKDSRYFETHMGYLVASGEQSFIEVKNDLCPSRKYVCVTPCFRDEQYDEFHFPYFFKVELIAVLWKTDDSSSVLKEVIANAQNFLGGYGNVDLESTDIGFDLTLGGYELGSYGIREYKDFRWVYGTGVAEPRLSQVVDKLRAAYDKKFAEFKKANPQLRAEACCECGEDYYRDETDNIYCELCCRKTGCK